MSQLLPADAVPVTLEEVLAARDARVLRQRRLLQRHGTALICLTLNIVGAVKRFPLADAAFDEALALIRRQLERARLPVAAFEEQAAPTGREGFFAVAGDAVRIKGLMLAIEEGVPLARLFDIDVLRPDGTKISRADVHLPSRRCLICREPAAACARSRAHPSEEVLRHSLRLMHDHFDGRFADFVAGCALKSMLYEVCTTPKPGLVDRNNNGSHRDMTMFSFVDSACVLPPYFRDCALRGLRRTDLAPDALFARLRYPGMGAEDAMFAATGGVNTHKGAIFSLGILCAAAGRLRGTGVPLSAAALGDLCARMTATVFQDYGQVTPQTAATHGERVYARTGITGIRGEVAGGFASVRRWSLPVLQELLERGHSPERAGTVALLHLMARVTDTNIITRTSLERQRALHEELRALLERAPCPDVAELLELDRRFMAENISPGGCADLLAVTWMLQLLCAAAS